MNRNDFAAKFSRWCHYSPRESICLSIYSICAIDKTGGGDAYIAGFLLEEEALELAQDLGKGVKLTSFSALTGRW
jgi:sugar/nucleoside kinase (ribokinase family)